MLGLRLGSTVPIDRLPVSRKRVRMSLRFVPMARLAIGRPMWRAAWAAKTLPKLPVGTANDTARAGAPSATAAQT